MTEFTVSSGFTSSGVVLNQGDTMDVLSGGIASATTVNGGGLIETAGLGGLIVSTLVNSGGLADVFFEDHSEGTLVMNGGVEVLEAFAISIGTVLSGGVQSLTEFGSASGTVVENLGSQVVLAGGYADGGDIGLGGVQFVFTRGNVESAKIDGGTEYVSLGGDSDHATVKNGGHQIIFEGGGAFDSLVTSGGYLELSGRFARADDATLTDGGQLGVNSASVSSDTIISSGGLEAISAFGTAESSTVSLGGVELMHADAIISDTHVYLGGAIDLADFAFSLSSTAIVDSATDILTVQDAGRTVSLQLAGDYADEQFALSEDTSGGTLAMVESNPCFCQGTRIMTARGAVRVEKLRAGDYVATVSGSMAPVLWIGRRRVDLARHPARAWVQPVRIGAGAFGAGLPQRDLLLSPMHAVLVDGVLIPVRHLAGFGGIEVDMGPATTTYYHIELSRHDVVLAEGLPCESWLDTGNRSMFENTDVAMTRFIDRQGDRAAEAWATLAYAPLVTQGPLLDAARLTLGRSLSQPVHLEQEGKVSVLVSPGTSRLRLISAAGVKAGDKRRLGAAIAAIEFEGRAISLEDWRLARGFHAPEASHRWTTGEATVLLAPSAEPRRLSLQVAAVASANPAGFPRSAGRDRNAWAGQ